MSNENTSKKSFDLMSCARLLIFFAIILLAYGLYLDVASENKLIDPATGTTPSKKGEESVVHIDIHHWSDEYEEEEIQVDPGKGSTGTSDGKTGLSAGNTGKSGGKSSGSSSGGGKSSGSSGGGVTVTLLVVLPAPSIVTSAWLGISSDPYLLISSASVIPSLIFAVIWFSMKYC